jgi:hypothetical protein
MKTLRHPNGRILSLAPILAAKYGYNFYKPDREIFTKTQAEKNRLRETKRRYQEYAREKGIRYKRLGSGYIIGTNKFKKDG